MACVSEYSHITALFPIAYEPREKTEEFPLSGPGALDTCREPRHNSPVKKRVVRSVLRQVVESPKVFGMRSVPLHIIAVAAFVVSGGSAHADIALGLPTDSIATVHSHASLSSDAVATLTAEAAGVGSSNGSLLSLSLDDGVGGLFDSPGTVGEITSANFSAAEIREVPPSPGSASLFLSAMLSVGAWNLLRVSRHANWSHVPDWYHTDCPSQIGHAVPFDFNFSALPLCCFELPAGQRPFLYRVQREEVPRCDAECFLTTTVPRGPPVPCF